VVSSKQRADVDKRVEFTAVTNAAQQTYKGQVINVHAAIQLAFVLGTRFGLKHPEWAGGYMGRWIADKVMDSSPEEVGRRHEQALHAITFPLQWLPEEWRELEGDDE